MKQVFTLFLLGIYSLSTLAPSLARADVATAQAEGTADGQPDGAREAEDRGMPEGMAQGQREGYRQGYDSCAAEERRRAYDQGYWEGERRGEPDGEREGEMEGRRDGELQGESDGRRDGETRADRDAYNDATPQGRQKGIEQANASDATERGNRDGIVAGDQAAMNQAKSFDYPRGHTDYRNERYAEPVLNQDAFSQKPGEPLAAPRFNLSRASLAKDLAGIESIVLRPQAARSASPDYRYSNPRRTYQTAEENTAYNNAYRSGYASGFQMIYGPAVQEGYNRAFGPAREDGCDDARRANYESDRRRGYDEGYRVAYREGYDRTYRPAKQRAYDRVYRPAYDRAYQSTYQPAWNRHYEAARSSAYAARVKELYDAAFSAAKTKKYNEVYPGYAAEQYKLGRQDEAADFAARPVRLLEAVVTETLKNGVFEPGEKLRVKLKLRNFADGAAAGKDVFLKLEALDAGMAIVSEGDSSLVKDLRNKSVTEVSNAFDFVMNESALNKTARFKMTVTNRGKLVAEQILEVKTQYTLGMELAEQPLLVKDAEMPIKLRVTNQSKLPTDAAAKILFSGSFKLEITTPEVVLGVLAPGQSKVLTFGAILKVDVLSTKYPLYFAGKAGDGRGIGKLETNDDIPVANEYRLKVANPEALPALHQPGTTRVELDLTNYTSAKGKQLEVKVSIDGDAKKKAKIEGANPQVVSPIAPGKSARISVPVVVKKENKGGTLELEIKQEGQVVLKSQVTF